MKKTMETAKVGDKIKFISSTDDYASVPTTFYDGIAVIPGDIGIITQIDLWQDQDENDDSPPSRKMLSVKWEKNKNLIYRLMVPGDVFEIVSYFP